MKRIILGLVVAILVGMGACRLLLPERFAVNAPISQMLFGRGGSAPPPDVVASRMRVPEGYAIGIFAEGIRNARFLQITSRGDLLVSTPRSGEIWLVERDRNGDGRSDGQRVLLSGLNRPHGVELDEQWLYVGEMDGVARVPFDHESASVSGVPEKIVAGLPEGGNHWSKTLGLGPDGWLYLHVGSSCNVCIEPDERRATIMRFRPDGSNGEVYATGLRNSVGFDWRPGTSELYATDNGRDLLGDDFPPCELNRIERGADYGWPFANGDRVPDPDFGEGNEEKVANSRAPAHAFRAHNAPLGITFVRAPTAPRELAGAALVALHGSWNRTEKDGYKVVSLHWGRDGQIEERDFAWGFLHDDDVIGRPVDVAEGPDGALYISDDFAGVIWRVSHGGARPSPAARAASEAPAPSPSDGGNRQHQTARGIKLYREFQCASCHEHELATPGVVVKPLADLATRYTVPNLASYLATPTPPMPVFPLDEQQRSDLAAYLLKRFP